MTMKRSVKWLAPRRRSDWPDRLRRLARRRWPIALNVATALTILWWLGSGHAAVPSRTSTRAQTMPTTIVDQVPAAVRELWHEQLESVWADEVYVPGSNQRVLGDTQRHDPDLEIVETRVAVRIESPDGSTKRLWVVRENTRELEAALSEAARVLADAEASDAREKAPSGAKPDASPSVADAKPSAGQGEKPRAASRADKKKAGSPKRKVRRLWFTVTAYCPCKKCCGRWAKYHKTASGLPVTYNGGHLVAADTDVLPFHTLVRIPGYADGKAVPVVDRGGAIKGRMIDVFFPTHWRAKKWGKKRLLVEVLD